MSAERTSLRNDAGQDVAVHTWFPAVPPRGVVVVSHGMAEHAARYGRFAEVLTKSGLAVYAPDHRGHGLTAAGRLGVGGPDAWNGTVRDLEAVIDLARAAHPGLPAFLFGHSMGSIVAQRLVQRRGTDLSGVILSGTTSGIANAEQVVQMARAQAAGDAADEPSPLAGVMFASFNDAFAPARTPFDWLSRDEAEVQKYIADPMCGFALSNGLLAEHLTGWVETWLPENEAAVPKHLPVLLFSGELDPVGEAGRLVTALAERYTAAGIAHVETVFYPAARHEMLNETNRDDVHADVVTWISAHLPA